MSDSDWELVIGLETHVQVLTRSKMFCGCSADYDGAEPNTHVCPICLGLPGALPRPNARVVELGTVTGLALGCRIAARSYFDRKNYHYPDLAKGYQISQYSDPLARDGRLAVVDDTGSSFTVGIERLHLEEDTAKLSHAGDHSLVDFNRSGVPLMEIVTRPDMRTPEEAKAALESLRQLLRWLGVSTGNMEAGALRADVNVSVRRVGAEEMGTKVEIKNLNSFAAVKAALEFERRRLIELVGAGREVRHETRGWSEAKAETVPQRTKEMAEDYRYFPDPDLPPLVLEADWIARLQSDLPELPAARRLRFAGELGLGVEEARLLTRDELTADYFEAAATDYAGAAQALASWITGPLVGQARAADLEWSAALERVAPGRLAELAALVDTGQLSRAAGKDVLAHMVESGRSPREIMAAEGLGQIDDESALAKVIAEVVSSNPGPVADYCGGKVAALGFLLGAVMRATRGQAEPGVARRLLASALDDACGAQTTIAGHEPG